MCYFVWVAAVVLVFVLVLVVLVVVLVVVVVVVVLVVVVAAFRPFLRFSVEKKQLGNLGTMKHMFNRIHFDPSGTCMSVKTNSFQCSFGTLISGGGGVLFWGGRLTSHDLRVSDFTSRFFFFAFFSSVTFWKIALPQDLFCYKRNITRVAVTKPNILINYKIECMASGIEICC